MHAIIANCSCISSRIALGNLSLAYSQSWSNALLLIASSFLTQPALDHTDTGNDHLIADSDYSQMGYERGKMGHRS